MEGERKEGRKETLEHCGRNERTPKVVKDKAEKVRVLKMKLPS